MQELEIVLGVIRQGDEYLLQNRDHNPSGAADMIGAYGGKIERKKDSGPEEATCRELAEETSLDLLPDDLSLLGEIDVVCDYKGKPAKIHGWAYLILLDSGVALESKEGTLVRMTESQVLSSLDEFTPGTRKCFEQYILSREVVQNG